jgi:hypothetical protein
MVVRIKDNGWKKLLKSIFKDDRIGVTVGIQGSDASSGHKGSDLTVAEVGEIHEFGLGVPRRSFLRGYYDENYGLLRKRLLKISKRIASPRSKLTAKKGMGLFGSLVVGEIQKRIASGIFPPLSEATKRARKRLGVTKKGQRDAQGRFLKAGSVIATPLINTGQLRSSITYKVDV